MKKRPLALIMVFALMCSMIASAPMTAYAEESYDGEFNIETGEGIGSGFRYASGELWFDEDGTYLVYGSGIKVGNRIRVSAGVTATVTVKDVNVEINLPFECGTDSNVTLILADDSENIFKSYGSHAGLRVMPTATLTITTVGQSSGNGSLSAYGGADSDSSWASAGIGGSELESSGTIVIDGGTILAKGGNGWPPGAWRGPGAAGIGGAQGRACGDITINGGTVTAIGGDVNPEGAGIGGGSSDPSSYSGEININGGTVRAYSGQAGPSGTGIGFCSSIAIADSADVQAYSSGNYSAIYGQTDTAHDAFLLNFMLDAAVSQDTDITITQVDDSTESFDMTLLANYKNFTATVETEDNYNAGLSDGSKTVAAVDDETTNFSGVLDSPGQSIAHYSVKLLSPPTYAVTIGTLSGGTIEASPTSAIEGTTINLTVAPDTGKQLKSGTLKYHDGSDHAIVGTSFTMPASDVTVIAEFEDIAAPVLQSAATSTDGSKVILTFDKAMADLSGKHSQFSVTSNGSGNAVTAAALGTNTKSVELTLMTPTVFGQTVTVSYAPGTVTAADGGMLAAITEYPVANNVGPVDNTAPVLTAGCVSRISDTEATVKFTSDEAGQYYYEVVPIGSPQPDIDTSGGGTACDTTEQTISLDSLTAGAKDIYIVVKDAAGNVSVPLFMDIAAYTPANPGTIQFAASSYGTYEGYNGWEYVQRLGGSDGVVTVDYITVDDTAIAGVHYAAKSGTLTWSDGDTANKAFPVNIFNDGTYNGYLYFSYVLSNPTGGADIGEQNPLNVQLSDNDNPPVPAGLQAKAGNKKVDLSWDPVNSAYYKLYYSTVNGEFTEDNSISVYDGETYTLTGLNNGTTYYFAIKAGHNIYYSALSDSISATPKASSSGGGGGAAPKAVVTVPQVVTVPPVLTDIKGHWAETAILSLVAGGAIDGYPDGTFKPQQTITRAEFATVLVKAFKLSGAEGKVFSDTAGHWAKDYIKTAYTVGIIEGYDAEHFGPDDLITREQMAVMIIRALQLPHSTVELAYSDSAAVSPWAANWVSTAAQHGLMNGYADNSFKPLANASRAEAVTVIFNALAK